MRVTDDAPRVRLEVHTCEHNEKVAKKPKLQEMIRKLKFKVSRPKFRFPNRPNLIEVPPRT